MELAIINGTYRDSSTKIAATGKWDLKKKNIFVRSEMKERNRTKQPDFIRRFNTNKKRKMLVVLASTFIEWKTTKRVCAPKNRICFVWAWVWMRVRVLSFFCSNIYVWRVRSAMRAFVERGANRIDREKQTASEHTKPERKRVSHTWREGGRESKNGIESAVQCAFIYDAH